MRPWEMSFNGRFEKRWMDSDALRGNPLGDPSRRPLWVYLPPGYDAGSDQRYPSIYMLQGLTGQVDMWWNRSRGDPVGTGVLRRRPRRDRIPVPARAQVSG
jgi:hypothetical protein